MILSPNKEWAKSITLPTINVNCSVCNQELVAMKKGDSYICLKCAFEKGYMTQEKYNELLKLMNIQETN